ncbi:ferrous iron transport protein B [Bifidobacterium crudilactis]|uniref:ferrous iron transport protein B n=1 Tax=Bifidobacterium crudilactis TaxID=327277 RepID=UPI000A004C4A|nr:ferrous iron transport protein B [Bifidobacterium crudilactis]MCI2149393.1 ferrous iron transport protein B [Bifidobacterium crudilactis]MCI2157504.1 ferrous iron transport protein B [Bifidobacterium crudilactis]
MASQQQQHHGTGTTAALEHPIPEECGCAAHPVSSASSLPTPAGCPKCQPAKHRHHRRGLAAIIPASSDETPSTPSSTRPRIVCMGNPNVGKSTLFNNLLGGSAKVMNAPGTTVLIESGDLNYHGRHWEFIDTPGTASLDAISPDEQVSCEAAMGTDTMAPPDVIVAVFNATSPSKSLYLLSQLIDLGHPLVVAVTMLDLAGKQDSPVTVTELSKAIPDIPFIPIDGRNGNGQEQLLQAIDSTIARTRSTTHHEESQETADYSVIDTDAGITRIPAPRNASSPEQVSDWVRRTADERFSWVAATVRSFGGGTAFSHHTTLSDRIDRVLLHPVFGILAFLMVMYAVFESITTMASPLIDFFDVNVRAWFTTGIDWVFTLIGGSGATDGWFHSLVIDGVLNGTITVLTFVPPMGIMFIILSMLEDSGYLARAAFVMDKAMRAIGLDGRAFLPLVVGFGCNLPALASTRTLPDSRQRLLTGLLIPFTSCSARLSVYIVLAYAFFGNFAGLAIFLMYVSSIVIILLVGLALRKTQFSDLRTQPFAMELPPYQLPQVFRLMKSVALRLWAFITGASSIIISMTIIMWLLAAVPVSAGLAGNNSFGHVDTVEHSLYGAIASKSAVVFEPAGFNDWHASAALITGFVAKEVVVGSMTQSYAIEESDDASGASEGQGRLGDAVRASFEQSSGGHGAAAAAAFMIFVLAYTPCLATVAEMKRQFGGRTALQSVLMGLAIAYALAVLIFQVGSLL